jgi:hypothetical protein
MTPLQSSARDGTIWGVTSEASITILEASFTLICDVYSIGVTCDDCQLTIETCLLYRPMLFSSLLLLLRLSAEMSFFEAATKAIKLFFFVTDASDK